MVVYPINAPGRGKVAFQSTVFTCTLVQVDLHYVVGTNAHLPCRSDSLENLRTRLFTRLTEKAGSKSRLPAPERFHRRGKILSIWRNRSAVCFTGNYLARRKCGDAGLASKEIFPGKGRAPGIGNLSLRQVASRIIFSARLVVGSDFLEPNYRSENFTFIFRVSRHTTLENSAEGTFFHRRACKEQTTIQISLQSRQFKVYR